MTTPTPSEFGADSGSGSRLMGSNELQQAINNLTAAVKAQTSALQAAGSNRPGGSPIPFGSTGQTFTSGSFPKMAPAASSFGGGGGQANATTSGGMGGTGSNPSGTLGAMGGQMMSGVGQMMTQAPQFSNQITMNQFASMSTLGMGRGNVSKQQQQMYRMAFGNYNSNLNALATNPADAAQMYSNLQGIAASPNVMNTALGRAGFGATAGFGYSNPALGGAGSSQAAAQIYSGQTSMLMRQLGYAGTPRASMGQSNPMSMGGVMQSILQRAYGRSSVSAGTLNAGLANNGKLQLNLKALGLDPNTMGPALQMYNKLGNQGLSGNQAQTLLNDAAHNANYNGQSAQKLLSGKYGIATSDLQKLKDTTAVQTGTSSGEMNGFDSAISQATTSVQKFDSVLNSILKATGLGTVMGSAHGFSGTMSSVGGAFGSLVGKGVGMLTRFGGAAGASGGSGGGTKSAGSSTGGASAGAVRTAIKDAESQVGRPYVWGGDNPAVGFDCSGLIEWAYGQAGIKLPRTSQEQWAALKNRSVAMDKIMAGDILFSAGSDGSPNNPGHEAMAISSSQIIEAPHTGANIRIRALNKGEWSHAGRPSGSMTGGGGTSGSNGKGPASTTVGSGNAGLGLAVGNYGSSDELSNTGAALLGGISGGSGMAGFGSIGNGQGSTGKAGSSKSGNKNVSTAGGGSIAANRALGQKMAKEMYGWQGAEWNALNTLWGKYESGWKNDAQNPGSTAFGIAQFLDSTWKPYGPKTSNPGLQIKYGLEYVHDRYKDPIHALQFELSHNPHWYDGGTKNAAAGVALVGERGPEIVKLGGGQQVMNASKTADILKGNHAKPGQTPWDSRTASDLFLASVPQNSHSGRAGKCEVNLNMPAGAIVVHANGTASDVSNSVRQIMAGIRDAMAEDDMIAKIQQGVMG